MPATKDKIRVIAMRNSPKGVLCEWVEDGDPISRTFHDQPLPSFYKALEAMPEHVCTLAELSGKDAEKIECTGITLTYRGEKDVSILATLTARKSLKRSGRILNLTTTPLSIDPPKEPDGSDHLSKEESAAVKKLVNEVLKYINGERSTQKLMAFVEEQKAAGEKKKGRRKADPAANVAEFPAMKEPAAAGN